MTVRSRQIMALGSAAALGLLLVWGVMRLPDFGAYPESYGDMLNAAAVAERHVTNIPSAVNFDYRAFDTLGEEFMLFVAVAGLAVLFREQRGQSDRKNLSVVQVSEAVRWMGSGLIGFTVLFGMMIVLHGSLTPGGGFQGGLILAMAVLLIYLIRGDEAFERVSRRAFVEALEASGAGAYILIGLAMLAAGGMFLENLLPIGRLREVYSGGTIFLINLATGVEVSAAFVLLFAEFLEESRKPSSER